MEVQETRVQTDRVLTIPNLLSMARLVGVPIFLWLVLWPVFGGPKNDGWAIVVLMLSGVSDYLDGKLARRWGQISRLGQLLDPAADRLYIVSTLVGLTWREILPWWLTALLVAREAFVGVVLLRLNRAGYGPLNVSFLGKAATFNLMYAFPLLLLGVGEGWVHRVAGVVSWAFIWWGTTLYWWAGALYAVQARQILQAERSAAV
ncbi:MULTISPECIES: CDP-alcohol phosphatidyltransferase family protein [Kitasatospora]|uniref:Putative CDP-diacylglycerol--glycerol-3-phosphate 3-phosphatidyltransferase n=1 Tax=Kitasatospora setae (strain ATCC 33774 / DSM 43861 / JCM 3304 / KCC A-0304 / NBRC 14216 / KM-6054) TaxID=452652 RepID=E4N835_KITSK|nr:CDP-alcohol phosphatidyltransferase family protein [Kitasatospora setae]BAJ27366.1 putative CDP-diacylglycerol--glycerol-3-phosphate 3-phosphatidyltransferase [Kitasatospora setae KM-6054]